MLEDPLFLLMGAVMLGVVVVLMVGIGGFAKGGEFNRKYANKLMRLRIVAQFVAVLLILLFVWIRRGG